MVSNASQTLYLDNTIPAFTIHLTQLINLVSTDKWEVGVCEVRFSPPRTGTVVGEIIAVVYCDLISQQFVGSKYVTCLRTFIYSSNIVNTSLTIFIICLWKKNISTLTNRDIVT